MTRGIRRLAVASTAAVVAACTFVTDSCGCVIAPPAALVVTGTVTRGGAPLASVPVTADVSWGACARFASMRVGAVTATTGADGAFAFVVRAQRAVTDACVRVSALRSASDPTPLATTSHHPQRITGYDAILGDTLQVVLVVP